MNFPINRSPTPIIAHHATYFPSTATTTTMKWNFIESIPHAFPTVSCHYAVQSSSAAGLLYPSFPPKNKGEKRRSLSMPKAINPRKQSCTATAVQTLSDFKALALRAVSISVPTRLLSRNITNEKTRSGASSISPFVGSERKREDTYMPTFRSEGLRRAAVASR